MKMRTAAILFLAAVAAMVTGTASAEPVKPGEFAKRLFGEKLDEKSYACFVRTYDAAHLARHPEQKVTVMKLLITAESKISDAADLKEFGPYMNYSFRLGLRFRTRAGSYDSSGYCGRPRVGEDMPDKLQLFCGVDCDGGGISVEVPNDKAALIRLERIRIWRNNKPDDEGFEATGGADDRLFRLDRVKLDECRSLITDREELAAIRRKK